ncbi:MAG: type VI secretion system Vgr family protein [Pseudomonadota bacterium]
MAGISDLQAHVAKLQEQLSTLAGGYSSASRLYALTFQDENLKFGSSGLLVEAFAAKEEINGIGQRDIILLSTSAQIELKSLIGQSASLHTTLSDGSRSQFTGLIQQAANLGSEGGMARYRIRLVPWIWLLTQCRTNRVWQDKSVIAIIESVFTNYPAHAAWRWSDEVAPFMQEAHERSLCTQYRESDYDFISRLLTEEGLNWRVEEDDKAPSGHRIAIFADSTEICATPENVSSQNTLGGAGIRFHGGRSREEQDAIQILGAKRTLHAAITTLLTTDYKAKQAISSSVPTHHEYGGNNTPVLESYDTPGSYAYATAAEAQRYAQIQMEATEARNKLWQAHSTVRSLRAGTRFSLSQGPLQKLGEPDPSYVVLAVTSIGINNLPKHTQEALAELFGAIPTLLEDCIHPGNDAYADQAQATSADINISKDVWSKDQQSIQQQQDKQQLTQVIAQAKELGYANHFVAVRADIPWRPVHKNNDPRHNANPSTHGSQSAIVVGANGEATASGANEIYCDRLGRVRIRYHWQGQHDDGNAMCWVRVAQRSAGAGMGVQFLPRIGQEVLVQFIEGDIDRPVILGALYNGQGEGGTIPTPGGNSDQEANVTVFEAAHDHAASAQGNLVGGTLPLLGGKSPVWHGASSDSSGHRNSSAITGIRSKEFGANGYNQLVFDDTDNQGRIQLKSTQAATELNLGHLLHTADNYRGSFRGLGAELRTDGYGAIRAGNGLLISSYKAEHSADQRDFAGDNVPGMAMMKQASMLAKTFSDAAKTHQTVQFASHIGSYAANASSVAQGDKKQAPIKALHTAVSGMLDQETLEAARSDAAEKNITAGEDKLPHSTDPIIAIAAKGGLSMVAGQDLQWNNGEISSFMSGLDTQFMTGNQFRIHTGQAIGVLAGAVKPGENNLGVQLIAAKDMIDIQAQSDVINIQARDEINILSSHAHIDWAAAKSISLSTAGGANITITNGNITVQCPGKILVQAGMKSFLKAEKVNYKLPVLPVANLPDKYSNRLDVHDLFVFHPFSTISYSAKFSDQRAVIGALDKHGRSTQIYAAQGEKLEILVGQSHDEWDMIYDYDQV